MHKPQDPCKHGLHKPSKVITKKHEISLRDLNSNGKYDMNSIIALCNKAIREHESNGFTVYEGPFLVVGEFSYSKDCSITYMTDIDNSNYNEEIAYYHAAIEDYKAQMKLYNEFEEKRKTTPRNLDEKIEKAKRRLANLEAHRDMKPLPYPSSQAYD